MGWPELSWAERHPRPEANIPEPGWVVEHANENDHSGGENGEERSRKRRKAKKEGGEGRTDGNQATSTLTVGERREAEIRKYENSPAQRRAR